MPTNSSDEFWSINGVSLNQYNWAVTSFGGSAFDLPVRRGENSVLAGRSGGQHRNKPADQRSISLQMWVTGAAADGSLTDDQRLQFNDNWQTLRRLLWVPGGGQVTLTRRMLLTVGGTRQLVTVEAQAELSGPMTPTMNTRTRAEFTIDLLLADPYFYGPQQTSAHITNGGASVTVTNSGDDIAGVDGGLEIDFVGPLANPVLQNLSFAPLWCRYGYAIGAGQTIRAKVATFEANRLSDGVAVPGFFSHGGQDYWMGLRPGANALKLTDDSGDAGYAVVRWRAPNV